jgi:hypothetical protein
MATRNPSVPASRPSPAGSCRGCPVACERVVYPAGCLESGCSRLYLYEEAGRTWFGCVEGVFGSEVDLARFRALQATRTGFGALRATREPLPICRSAVERTFEHRADGPCVNPDFLLSAQRRAYHVSVAPQGGAPA